MRLTDELLRKQISDYIRWHARNEELKHRRLHPDAFYSVFAELLRDLAKRVETSEDERTTWKLEE